MNRTSKIARNTGETQIDLSLDLDGDGRSDITTGLGFFDHMLTHIAKHSRVNLMVRAKGDLHVDEHHLIEDVGICFGRSLLEALGDKKGIERFGTAFVTMDEALARTTIDLSGRAYLVFNAQFSRESINGVALETIREFYQAVANEGKMTLHISLLHGANAHHQVEAIFKSFGRALHEATRHTGSQDVPSTKGLL